VSAIAEMMRLAGTWGLPETAAVGQVSADHVSAIRWQHGLPEFADSTLPTNTLVLMMASGRSFRHRGGQREPASHAIGGMGLMPQGSYGGWSFESAIDVLHIHVPERLLGTLSERSGFRPGLQLDDRIRIDDAFLRAAAEEIAAALGAGAADRLYVDTLGAGIALHLIRRYSDQAGRSRALVRPAGGLTPWQTRRVSEYLDAHLAKDVRLATLADLVGLSPSHFCTAFRLAFGEPPHRHLVRRRIERAKIMLADPRLSVTEIALAVGFGSSAHFATAFRKLTGATPSSYRREVLP
jgi:AraC-like DNA-binding protein